MSKYLTVVVEKENIITEEFDSKEDDEEEYREEMDTVDSGTEIFLCKVICKGVKK